MSEQHGSKRAEPLRELQKELGRLLENFEPAQGWLASRSFPTIDLRDAGDRYLITAEVPGMAPGEVEVTIVGDELRLRGERKRLSELDPRGFRIQERRFGPWHRTLTMPERVDAGKVTAQFANGILTVVLPKGEEAKPRTIEITPTYS